MTLPKAGTGAAKPCPECKLTITTSYQRWLDEPERFCYAATSGTILKAKLSCARRQIANLKEELDMTKQELNRTLQYAITEAADG